MRDLLLDQRELALGTADLGLVARRSAASLCRMRSRRTASWSASDRARLGEPLHLALEQAGHVRIGPGRQECLGEADLGSAPACSAMSRASAAVSARQSASRAACSACGAGRVELDQRLAGRHPLAVADQDAVDDAAFQMLDGLAAAVGDDDGGRHGGTGQGCRRGPAAEAGEEGQGHRGAGEQRAAERGRGQVVHRSCSSGRTGGADQGGEDGLLGAEAGDGAVLQHQDLVGQLQELRAVGDDDDRHAVLLQAADRAMSAPPRPARPGSRWARPGRGGAGCRRAHGPGPPAAAARPRAESRPPRAGSRNLLAGAGSSRAPRRARPPPGPPAQSGASAMRAMFSAIVPGSRPTSCGR